MTSEQWEGERGRDNRLGESRSAGDAEPEEVALLAESLRRGVVS